MEWLLDTCTKEKLRRLQQISNLNKNQDSTENSAITCNMFIDDMMLNSHTGKLGIRSNQPSIYERKEKPYKIYDEVIDVVAIFSHNRFNNIVQNCI